MTEEKDPPKAPRTLSDDDVKVERKQVVRTAVAIKGGAGQPDDPDRRGGTPATDHDS